MGRISGSVGAQKTRYQSMNTDDLPSPKRRRVGLLYDDRLCKHFDSADHVENPNRILSIWNKLQSSGINQRCVVLNVKEAEDSHIALVHSKKHVDLIKSISSPGYDLKRSRVANRFDSIYFNKGSSEAACLAAGSVVEVAEKVAKGELDSGFAIVRPPGHHAEANEPMGFCLLNNVAIAASYILNQRTDLGIRKILIVDWDVHHGNGTQKMFWKDPRGLVFSVHRHENGTFYPGGDDGSYQKIGEGPGAGYNINVPWENDSCGDADYVAAWDHVLIPVAKAFDPDLIIVSAGFDAAINDPLGGCCVTPYGFSIMLSKLMEFAHGKIVMALEGGYNLESLANSSLACVETLLDEKPVAGSLVGPPLKSTLQVIQAVREHLSPFWPILSNQLPVDGESDDASGKGIFIPSFKKVTNAPLDTPELRADFVLNALPPNHIKSWLSQCTSVEDRHMAAAVEHLYLASTSCQERKDFHKEMDEKKAALAKCHEDLKVQTILVNDQKVALEKKDKRIVELESALETEHSAKAVLQGINTGLKGQVHALTAECAALHGRKAECAWLITEGIPLIFSKLLKSKKATQLLVSAVVSALEQSVKDGSYEPQVQEVFAEFLSGYWVSDYLATLHPDMSIEEIKAWDPDGARPALEEEPVDDGSFLSQISGVFAEFQSCHWAADLFATLHPGMSIEELKAWDPDAPRHER